MDTTLEAPAGFQRHVRRSPLTDPWEPLWSRQSGDTVVLAIRAGPAHTNNRGFVHGGLITALSDNAMGFSCGRSLDEGQSLITVNLSIDFLGTAQIGQWLEFDTVFVKRGSTLCFTQAFVTADGQPCARANAVFRVVRKAHA